MLFNSIQFLFFFPLVTLLYFLLPLQKQRVLLLLAASCYFYMFFIPVYILILLFTIVIDYYAGIWIERQAEAGRKKKFLVCSLAANIGVLAFFKYYNFINDNLTHMLGIAGHSNSLPYLSIILPIGLSFHTFQAMSYTVEVYRGNQRAERDFITYALYVMFYPQLVAGPIERPQNILPQLHEKKSFDKNRLMEGLQLMVWGLLKKVVIADQLAVLADPVFNNVHAYTGWDMLMATYLFTIQIYCDFSGYSDIAIGSARVMGIDLMQNFNTPYFSLSVSEFWKRWHISLSTWFRDYLYIPLGGNRKSKYRTQLNVFIVFLVSGLWHGASWCFVAWGALHGLYILIESVTKGTREKLWKWSRIPHRSILYKAISICITFHLVALAWIFFRAQHLSTALYMIREIFYSIFHSLASGLGFLITTFSAYTWAYLQQVSLLLSVLTLLALLAEWRFKKPLNTGWKKYLYFLAVLMLIILLGKSEQQQFIYFQF